MTTSKRIFVIPDIHGCLRTFKATLEKINLRKDDDLYLLGDYIDRGPDSDGVLDFIIQLKDDNYSVFPLLGNHEQTLVQTYLEYERNMFAYFVKKMNKSENLLDQDDKIKPNYVEFINQLKTFYELDNFFIVHAGIDFKSPNPLQNYRAMLEIRFFDQYVPPEFPKTIVHGHNPTYIEDILEAVEKRKKVIPLDNGCVYSKKHRFYDHTRLGNLCCLELNSFDLILQKNIELTSKNKDT